VAPGGVLEALCSVLIASSSLHAVARHSMPGGRAAQDGSKWVASLPQKYHKLKWFACQSESSVSQSLSHDDSVSSIVAHGAEVGSSRAPHFDGANR
jgi:hypothetical protein